MLKYILLIGSFKTDEHGVTPGYGGIRPGAVDQAETLSSRSPPPTSTYSSAHGSPSQTFCSLPQQYRASSPPCSWRLFRMKHFPFKLLRQCFTAQTVPGVGSSGSGQTSVRERAFLSREPYRKADSLPGHGTRCSKAAGPAEKLWAGAGPGQSPRRPLTSGQGTAPGSLR